MLLKGVKVVKDDEEASSSITTVKDEPVDEVFKEERFEKKNSKHNNE